MKKMLLVMMLLLSTTLISAVSEPTTPIVGDDAENLQVFIMNNSPLDDSGEVNISKYQPFVTRAEERIDAINLWLDSNVSWMRYIFWMRPQVSWLFAFNLYFILLFLVILVFNAEGLWFFIDKRSSSMLFGLAVFITFSVARLYVGLANIANLWMVYIFDVLIPSLKWLGIILFVITIILAIFFPTLLSNIFSALARYFEAKKTFKKKMEFNTLIESQKKFMAQINK